ncbi:superoxide dismutase [Starmerella bacillaris]|uniref:Superoxide dismutase n=1 Tax=Starmerella bacillaris TaxID=1247836 RepID=A0AAV5RJ79_STABA|nr:superoxide dismutase [Starmerella bacillaris]
MLRILSRPVKSSAVNRAFSSLPPKAVQPDLDYDFGALEPYISAEIMETHYTKHHRTYIAGYNTNIEKFAEAVEKNDVLTQTQLLPNIRFHGGGFVNHNIFWKSLAPPSAGGGELPKANSALGQAVTSKFGTFDNLINLTNAELANIKGSGWAWLAQNKASKQVEIIATANQDSVPGTHIPLLGIDAWEHAYYLQYKNVKAEYFKAIWNVINWKEAESRFLV